MKTTTEKARGRAEWGELTSASKLSSVCECVRAGVVHAVQVRAAIGNSMENSGEVISRGVQDILKAKTSHRKKYVECDPVRTSEIR